MIGRIGKSTFTMKKVLFILDNLEGGGAERVFVNIANSFVENNIEVQFLAGKKTGVYLDILNPRIAVMEVGSTTLLAYLRTFPRIFRKHQFTHVFTASHYSGTAAIISKRITGTAAKIYFTHHYAFPATRPLKYLKGDIILRLIHFFITPYADKIIGVSKGTLEWLRKFSHRKLPQGSFIYNPVFDDTIYSLASEQVDFPIDVENKIILLNVARLTEVKDQETLIDAFDIFKQTHPGALLFILGTGPMQSKLEKYIRVKELSASVFLMGFQTNPYKWMARCDVLILSSISEGFGNVLVEAMALGKTVVSTDCPTGPREILNHGEFGYLCPVKDPAALADTISKAVVAPLDPELVKKSSKQFTIKAIVEKYMDIL